MLGNVTAWTLQEQPMLLEWGVRGLRLNTQDERWGASGRVDGTGAAGVLNEDVWENGDV
jgi:hypothetical protein